MVPRTCAPCASTLRTGTYPTSRTISKEKGIFSEIYISFQKLGKKLSMDKAGVQKNIPASTKRNILGIQVGTVRNQPNTYMLSDFQRWKIYPKLLKDMLTFHEKMLLALNFSQLDTCWQLAKVPCITKTPNQLMDDMNKMSLALRSLLESNTTATWRFIAMLILVIWFQCRCSTNLLFQLVYPVTWSH